MTTTGPVTSPPGVSADGPGRSDVELRLPADGAYASVLRTTTAALAARLDFTIDDIEDLRIAVGEAHALVLDHASPSGDLTCGFSLSPGRIDVVVAAPVDTPPVLDRESFAWQVLTTLAADTDLSVDDGVLRVRLSMRSQALDAGPGATPDVGPDVGPDAG